MQIVLLGYMGSGKSTIGKILSKKLNISFLDLDDYIEEALGSSISNVFEQQGEIFFRKKEHFYLNEILTKKDDFILSTGGGTPCYSGNVDLMLEKTPHVFYLKVSISGLVERLLKEKDHRPLIKNISEEDLPEFIGKHLFERNPFYQASHKTISCDNKSPESIAEEIIAQLG